ncbi:hypothetical protein [Streptomyces sp. NPDC059008]|uniref:hypothetical protein n=1 Tax=Streptomyces sp. NPDC059008 TaxID=3346693 RepID=UPI00367C6D8C
MQYRITAPVDGHSGVVAGITFADGVATCCDPPLGALEYFRRHGYELVCLDVPEAEVAPIGFTAETPPAEDKPAARSRSKQRNGDGS